MTTYKRPDFLQDQLKTILQQTFSNYQVIISDNDVDASAKKVVEDIADSRIIYYNNGSNLGMIASFNNSLTKAVSEYVVMITDDDPVYPEMLTDFFELYNKHPDYPVYIGAMRAGKKKGGVEVFTESDFAFEILHPGHTSRILWSSCILKTTVAIKIGGMPDYGSPHLADHALIILCSKYGGGIIINKIYGHLTSHKQNFSKRNLNLYQVGCEGFFKLISNSLDEKMYVKWKQNALIMHLENWFITNSFSLRYYFTYLQKDEEAIHEINSFSAMILQLEFMRSVKMKYYFKLVKFYIKRPFYYFKSFD